MASVDKNLQKDYEQIVFEDPEKLKDVPYEFKSYDMCLRTLLVRPDLVKYVPISILTAEFEAELKKRKVEIPEKLKRYVWICRKIQQKRRNLEVSLIENPYIPVAIGNISLSNLNNLISLPLLRDLNDLGVETLGQLFQITSDDMNVFKWSGRHRRGRELEGVQRILRCKYLNEDPKVDENDETLSMDAFYSSLGFSVRAVNSLLRSNKFSTAKSFFSAMRSEDPEYELASVKDCGIATREEVLEKANIVIEYHDRVNGLDQVNNQFVTPSGIEIKITSPVVKEDNSIKTKEFQTYEIPDKTNTAEGKVVNVNGKNYDSTNPSDREELLNLLDQWNINLHPDTVIARFMARDYDDMSLGDLKENLQHMLEANDELNKAINFVTRKIKEKEKKQAKEEVL